MVCYRLFLVLDQLLYYRASRPGPGFSGFLLSDGHCSGKSLTKPFYTSPRGPMNRPCFRMFQPASRYLPRRTCALLRGPTLSRYLDIGPLGTQDHHFATCGCMNITLEDICDRRLGLIPFMLFVLQHQCMPLFLRQHRHDILFYLFKWQCLCIGVDQVKARFSRFLAAKRTAFLSGGDSQDRLTRTYAFHANTKCTRINGN
ncbi:hypothetical protein DFH11DRAFT_800070 [Phellopilus nigrolimitatus]|nr:hypothetical protein DFH11DRAFT_800070 [Phellopilus nigrolimitatus]